MYIEQLSVELQEQAKREINEIPSETPNHIQHIRDWLKEHPEIHARTEELWLLNFLRGCKFSLEKTKKKLENFHKVRFAIPKFFANRDPLLSDIQDFYNSGLIVPLITKKQVNLIVRFKNIDPKKFPLELIMRAGLMIFEVFIRVNNVCMVSGFHLIIDYAGFSYTYLTQLSPDIIKKMAYVLRNAYPFRIRGIHLINVPMVLDAVISIAKPLLNKELIKLHVYREEHLVNLFDIVPKDGVPIEYGGDTGTIPEISAHWSAEIIKYRDWFLEDARHYPHLKQTPEIKAYAELQGSFKKLDLD